jgi:hypothetical protein
MKANVGGSIARCAWSWVSHCWPLHSCSGRDALVGVDRHVPLATGLLRWCPAYVVLILPVARNQLEHRTGTRGAMPCLVPDKREGMPSRSF